jgi:glyoxylase-like metal-dependent hydrolase (beta-lactamase superfamily II)
VRATRTLPALRTTALLVALAASIVAALPAGSGAAAGDRVPIARWKPLPAAARVRVSPEARAMRERVLGPRALDPRYVTLAWYGVSSFVVTIRGHLLLFDAWEIVGAHRDYAPIGREELAALDPEAILIGHGHFDHAADAGYVAGRSGAAVVGSEEICDTAKADAARDGLEGRFLCAITGTAETPAPGTIRSFRLFEDVAPVRVLQHIHSAARPPSEENPPAPFAPVFDPEPYLRNPNLDPDEIIRFFQTQDDPQGGTWMYHFTVGDFTLLLGDSAGPIWESEPVRRALNRFPGCVDVMANSILGFDQPVSGMRDPRLYVEHAHPRLFLPTHGDAWAPVLSAGQAQYRAEWDRQMRELAHPPAVDFLEDPGDYLAERAYRVTDRRWTVPMPGSSCASRRRP